VVDTNEAMKLIGYASAIERNHILTSTIRDPIGQQQLGRLIRQTASSFNVDAQNS